MPGAAELKEKSKTTAKPTAAAPKQTTGLKPAEVVELARKKDIKIIDLKFVDVPGTLQHMSITHHELDESLFTNGIGFDGSSIRGFQHIHESDMLLLPDASTGIVDPCCAVPTLSLMCNVMDPVTRQMYPRDPRNIAQRAEAYLASTGIADTSFWGPEIEFFVFDHVDFDQNMHEGYYHIDSDDGIWNSGRAQNGTTNLGWRPRSKEGYFPCAPVDAIQDFRSRAVLKMMEAGIRVEVHHHEVSTAGQCEIDMRFDTLTTMADRALMYKYILRNVAKEHNKTVTFMPKPLFGDNGSGMHVHSSLWKNGTPLFYDKKGYGLMSKMGMHYIGGLLKHGQALMAICAPTTNSYRRLVPGYEAPVNLVYSQRNRSASARIPMYFDNPNAKRIEFRPPDPSSNPYLVFSAILLAGLDGVENKIDPGQPIDKDIYTLPEEEARKIPQVPGSLADSLNALEKDHAFLLKGGVFTEEFIRMWIEMKRKEVDAVRLRPHPYEFFLYYDC